MKKLTACLMGLVMVLGLAACSSENPTNSPASGSSQPQSASAAASDETSAASDSGSAEAPASNTGKTLVVYYSATGNTEEAAGYIAEATGGDLFELEPADPYTDDDLNYGDEDSRVVYEHDNPEARDVELVADTVDNWAEYDRVFIGYPKMEQGYICV